MPFLVGTPKGSVARFLQLGSVYLQAWPANLGQNILALLLFFSFFAKKTAIFGSNRAFPSVFWFFGLMHEPGPSKTGSRQENGRWENTPCHRIDRLLEPNWPPGPPQDPRRPPRPLQESFGKICIFSKRKSLVGGRVGNLLAVTRCRFAAAGDGSRRLNRCIETIKKGYWSKKRVY